MAEPVEWDSLTAEEKKMALADEPVSSATHMGLQGSVMQSSYAPVIHQPGEGLRTGMAASQQNLANVPIRMAESLGAQPGGLGMMGAQAARGTLNFLTSPFGSPEGAAVTGAIAPLRAASLLPGVRDLPARSLQQISALTGIGAGTAATTGGSPLKGGLEGLAAGTIGAAFGKVSDIFKQRKQDAYDVANAIAKEVPWIEGALPGKSSSQAGTIEPLLAIQDKAVGYATLQRRFWEVKQAILDKVGSDALVEVPAIDTAGASGLIKRISGEGGQRIDASTARFIAQQMQKSGAFQDQTMTMGKALGEVVRQNAIARKAADGAEGWAARERARSIQESIDKVVGASDSQLLSKYQEARTIYGKGMEIFGPDTNILKDSGALELGRTGGKINLQKLTNYLQHNIDEYGPTKFPDLYAAANRGAGLGASDITRSLRLPRVYGKGLSEGIPLLSINQPTGRLGVPDMGNPTAGLRAAFGSVIPPEWLTQQPVGQSPVQ